MLYRRGMKEYSSVLHDFSPDSKDLPCIVSLDNHWKRGQLWTTSKAAHIKQGGL